MQALKSAERVLSHIRVKLNLGLMYPSPMESSFFIQIWDELQS